MATIADVAAYAGVGAGTVSRVLNNRPNVRPDTRARVHAAIKELDYRPSPLARGLSRGHSQSVRLVMPFCSLDSTVERLRGVVHAVADSRYDLVLVDVASPPHRDERFATLSGRDHASGVLVVGLGPSRRDLQRLRKAGIPLVLVGGRAPNVPAVVVDDVEGGRLATRHLVALGHERIAYLGEAPDDPYGGTASAEREQGYREALDTAGIAVRRSFVAYGPRDHVAAHRLAERLLAQRVPPTAVFASSDVQALGVLDAARAARLDVPRDLSVVGCGDTEIASYTRLTTVSQPLYECGRRGARLLLDALEAGAAPDAETYTLPVELVERSTTASPRRGGTH